MIRKKGVYFFVEKNGKIRRDELELDLAGFAMDDEPLGAGREDVMIPSSTLGWYKAGTQTEVAVSDATPSWWETEWRSLLAL